jgi:hypothetical protein
MRIRYPAPIEAVIEEARWNLSEHLHSARVQGATYRQLAEANRMDRKTVRLYVRTYETAARRYGWVADLTLSCNGLSLRCHVCGETFEASRGDARYCSNACRQDAYRKRKLGAVPTEAGS